MRSLPGLKRGVDAVHVIAQTAAAWVGIDASARAAEIAGRLEGRERAFQAAMRTMQAVREYVGYDPIPISPGKHGFNAEILTVGTIRARDILEGRVPSASFGGISPIGPVDYTVDYGTAVQSKYYNGLKNTLDAVIRHNGKYPWFTQDGELYHIPSDQHQRMIELVTTGRIEGASERTVRAAASRLRDIEVLTGRPAAEVIGAGEGTYPEVQQGRIQETITRREAELRVRNDELKNEAVRDTEAGLADAIKAVAIGAAAAGGLGLAHAVWAKQREGRSPFRGEFTDQDWRDVGVTGSKAAGTGAVAGGGVYLLTNSTALAAPLAGSLVSGLMAVGGLLRDHHAGLINEDELVELIHTAGIDAAVAGVAAVAGQAAIPIPVLGALLGCVAGKMATAMIQSALEDAENEVAERLDKYEADALGRLDSRYRELIGRIESHFDTMDGLRRTAFDNGTNAQLRFTASRRLAELVGVPRDQILASTRQIDAFMRN